MGAGVQRVMTMVEAVRDEAGFAAVLRGLREAFGVDSAAFVIDSARPLAWREASAGDGCVWMTRPQCFAVTNYAPSWARVYEAEGYAAMDPVWRAARERLGLFDWDSLDWSADSARRIRTESRAHGLGARGATVALHGDGGRGGLLSVAVDMPAEDWRALLDRLAGPLMLVAYAMQQKVSELEPDWPGDRRPALAPLERAALDRVGKGFTPAESAADLGVTRQALRAALETACEKLGARHVAHAVALTARSERLGH